ncbi:hypothetical protein CHS0354_000148 [Potamilus streckersoni]|uniref:Uncharacterized protein n=1 Tax=Potamilus streckersoni TaxID=2493646 RepID=A0AAE0RXS1_9BIVA|nr:hypothetical protein CHS0354_000148 [Potamilus streckersoni]
MEVLCIALHFLFVQSSLGILDGMVNSDVSAVKIRLEEEKEKRLLLENDMEILMLKAANLTRTVEKFATADEFPRVKIILVTTIAGFVLK